jgi:hypothetical protein
VWCSELRQHGCSRQRVGVGAVLQLRERLVEVALLRSSSSACLKQKRQKND